MTAHVVYSAIDPERAGTVSPAVIAEVIRGRIGFDGLLLSDDLSMEALTGSLGSRTEAALAAGCDVALHCNGSLEEMREVTAASSLLSGRAAARTTAALDRLGTAGKALNVAEARAGFSAMMMT
jgi:beta-N-acetylhexosaminidase